MTAVVIAVILLHTVPEYTMFSIFYRSNRLQYLCTTLQALNGYTKFYNYIKKRFNIMHYSVTVRYYALPFHCVVNRITFHLHPFAVVSTACALYIRYLLSCVLQLKSRYIVRIKKSDESTCTACTLRKSNFQITLYLICTVQR